MCILTSVPGNDREETFCKIVGVKIDVRDIESCHRVGSQSGTIVKFSHMKNCHQLIKVKNDLFKLSLIDRYRSRQHKNIY